MEELTHDPATLVLIDAALLGAIVSQGGDAELLLQVLRERALQLWDNSDDASFVLSLHRMVRSLRDDDENFASAFLGFAVALVNPNPSSRPNNAARRLLAYSTLRFQERSIQTG